jgi:hypothetical protein
MNQLGNLLELASHVADPVDLVTDLLDDDGQRDDRPDQARRWGGTAYLAGVVALATVLFLLMSYLTAGRDASVAGPRPERAVAGRASAWFADCAAARTAGAAPLIASQRAYRPGLDDVGDGVASEEGETGQA